MKPSNNQPRGVIIQFPSRIYRDAVWRSAKKSTFLKDNNLKLAEDLSADDRARRNRLWPAVDKARKENKLAFFVGGRAFVNGKEIFPPQWLVLWWHKVQTGVQYGLAVFTISHIIIIIFFSLLPDFVCNRAKETIRI